MVTHPIYLIITVDAPNDSLNENLVLVHGNQGTQSSRSEALIHDGICGAIAFKYLVLHDILNVRSDTFTLELSNDFLCRLSLH